MWLRLPSPLLLRTQEIGSEWELLALPLFLLRVHADSLGLGVSARLDNWVRCDATRNNDTVEVFPTQLTPTQV